MTYKRRVMFEFEFKGEVLETTGVYTNWAGDQILEWSETKKNGQEDTHISGTMFVTDGRFIPEDGDESVDLYRSKGFVKALAKFFTKNPPPPCEDEPS